VKKLIDIKPKVKTRTKFKKKGKVELKSGLKSVQSYDNCKIKFKK